MNDFPHVTLRGDAGDRGFSHGRQLKDRIQATWAFYEKSVFPGSSLSAADIRERALGIADRIARFNPAYPVELEAIASGAGLEPWQIYALNARTEILNAGIAECTSVYLQDSALLGQTWDWFRELEALVVTLHYEDLDGKDIITLAEPGMMAKIGMNDCGLGVCLNFLVATHGPEGVPVHIVLRAILECGSLAEAKAVIRQSGFGKSSHFLVGDASGQCFSIEFSGDQSEELETHGGWFAHTNHCIGKNVASEIIPTTVERLSTAREILGRYDRHDKEALLATLLNDEQDELSIRSAYRPEETLGGLEVGTCATIFMDLRAGEFRASKGPGAFPEFQAIKVL